MNTYTNIIKLYNDGKLDNVNIKNIMRKFVICDKNIATETDYYKIFVEKEKEMIYLFKEYPHLTKNI